MAFGRARLALLPVVCLCAQFAEYEPTELPFVHQPSKTSRKYLLESVGSGVALLDYDGDGRLDIYLVNGSALRDPMPKKSAADKREPVYWNRLYRNLGAGKWEDVTERAGVRGAYYGMGAAAADFDNDGDTDLYVTGYPSERAVPKQRGRNVYRDLGAGGCGGRRLVDGCGVAGCRWGWEARLGRSSLHGVGFRTR